MNAYFSSNQGLRTELITNADITTKALIRLKERSFPSAE